MNPDPALDHLRRLTGQDIASVRPIGGQHGYRHLEIAFADGAYGFAKATSGKATPGEAFAAEANGLRWLAEADAVPVPRVLGVDETALVITMVRATRATKEAAYRFGGDLTRMHAVGHSSFGAPWPGVIAGLPLDNASGTSWPEWYAERRLEPFLRRAIDDGKLKQEDAVLVEAVIARATELAGPAEPPSRIHGDCWSGNVLWSGGRGWLIDPAAHGGHRETDLAMLALFGAPHLDSILAGYTDSAPLADGWHARIPLHQLHPLLVHACLFGASYRQAVCEAARSALAGRQRP
jgi:fructosamine-3-kinase